MAGSIEDMKRELSLFARQLLTKYPGHADIIRVEIGLSHEVKATLLIGTGLPAFEHQEPVEKPHRVGRD
jgi:hypothetical protein